MTTTTTRGFREPSYFVLASLLDGPRHGYGIIKQAAALSGGEVRLAPGTLYGALDRLAGAGLIESSGQEVVAGRPRHYYRLTDVGRSSLLVEARRLAAAACAVLNAVDAADGEADGNGASSTNGVNGTNGVSGTNGTAGPGEAVIDLSEGAARKDEAIDVDEIERLAGRLRPGYPPSPVSSVSATQPSVPSSRMFNGVASRRA